MSSVTGGANVIKRTKSGQIIFIVSVLLVFVVNVPGTLSEKANDTSEDESETFSQSPTNHEKVLSKKKQAITMSEESGGDDYWVGSHKLEFKPHPLLMPSTQAPNVQIPIPLIEMGLPPTTSIPTVLNDEDNDGAPSNEQKLKVKPRKSRDRRKKSRNQRLLTHRTLNTPWANTSTNNVYLRAIQKHPQLLQSPSYYVGQQQPVIITSAGVTPVSNSLYLPAQATKNDDTFHGTSTTWNINHPGNNLQSYISGQISSQENQVVQNFPSSSVQQLPYRFSQLGHTQQFIQQYSPPHATPPVYQPLSISPSAPDTFADNIFMNSHQMTNHYIPQQHQASAGAGGSSGPVIVYVSSSGMTNPSAPGPIPIKTYNQFNQNEIPIDFSQKPQYPMTGPSSTTSNNPSSGKQTTNPQYFRNNFIRMFMDKLANVGKVLPIPFVTKYSSSQNVQQGFNSHNHFHRRM